MTLYKLPADYVIRPEPLYFDDAPYARSEIIHQPEVYEAADYLLKATGRTTIIDIGCGNGRKLHSVTAHRHIGIDFGPNLALCREQFGMWGEWIEADFSKPSCASLAQVADRHAVIVCADVVEHLLDPRPLLSLLTACYNRGAIVLTSTPDRVRVRGQDHKGPPPNPSHIREWALSEYATFLSEVGLPSLFAGYTINNNVNNDLRTIVTLHDKSAYEDRPVIETPIAILSTFNEEDVVEEVIRDLITQGCDVIVLDNWSTDNTWTLLEGLRESHPERLQIEKFPGAGPSQYYEWGNILRRKEEIALRYPGRWIIHSDADEIRRPPFLHLTLAAGLGIAQAAGANRVNFGVINFRPVDDRSYQPGSLTTAYSHFDYGARPGHFQQSKAWLQGSEKVDLASSGGHIAAFSQAKDYPYRFLLQHYPIRSLDHGRRKILKERHGRWSPDERQKGWHTQYDTFTEVFTFPWTSADLRSYEHDSFWHEYGLLIMTDLMQRRVARGLQA